MGRTHPTLKLSTMFRIKHLILLVAFQAGFDLANGKRGRQVASVEDRAGACAFDYSDTNWGDNTGPDCGNIATCGSGTDQVAGSPINIVPADAAKASCRLPFIGDYLYQNTYKTLEGSWEQKGFTFQWTKTSVDGPMITYTSPFTDSAHNYELLQIHYHWDASDALGSEHTVDGKAYPLEVHFVHGNTKYKSNGQYLTNADGLLVIGVFYEIGADGTQNPWVAPQAELAKNYATNPTATTTSNQENMWNTLKTALENGHYNYKGSLTTPDCNEVVTWVVAKTPLKIHADDLAKFRMLNVPSPGTGKVTRNWRPVQDIGSRTVYDNDRSWDYGSWAYYYALGWTP